MCGIVGNVLLMRDLLHMYMYMYTHYSVLHDSTILIVIAEHDTRKYHGFIAGYCLRVHNTSNNIPKQ